MCTLHHQSEMQHSSEMERSSAAQVEPLSIDVNSRKASGTSTHLKSNLIVRCYHFVLHQAQRLKGIRHNAVKNATARRPAAVHGLRCCCSCFKHAGLSNDGSPVAVPNVAAVLRDAGSYSSTSLKKLLQLLTRETFTSLAVTVVGIVGHGGQVWAH